MIVLNDTLSNIYFLIDFQRKNLFLASDIIIFWLLSAYDVKKTDDKRS